MNSIFPIMLILLFNTAALAQPVGRARVGFTAFVAGFNVMSGEMGVEMRPDSYTLGLRYEAVGLFGAFFPGEGMAKSTGGWRPGGALPTAFTSWGMWRGKERHAEIVYADHQPFVHILIPAQDTPRDRVPPELQRDTVDSFSMFAVLMHQVDETGACDGTIRTFDGRRLAEIAAHTVGTEILPPESRSSFQGPALRCDVVSRQLAGFPLDAGPNDSLRQPLGGSIWMARLVPGMPPMPVLMSLETRLVGHVNLYVTKVATDVDVAAFTPRRPQAASPAAGQSRLLGPDPGPR